MQDKQTFPVGGGMWGWSCPDLEMSACKWLWEGGRVCTLYMCCGWQRWAGHDHNQDTHWGSHVVLPCVRFIYFFRTTSACWRWQQYAWLCPLMSHSCLLLLLFYHRLYAASQQVRNSCQWNETSENIWQSWTLAVGSSLRVSAAALRTECHSN